ncbi:glycoside hydrolase family 3 protein [Spirilliplanes yamanashiensis]|uniref:glycoside hydrolase family 3 protein n=1 Tax=Spirilliplanes yamanashiensis TaxID=42233 RepID=UPI003F9445BC
MSDSPATTRPPYLDAGLPVAARVADLLARMSLADKVGQMTQAERASVTPADVTAYRLGSMLSGGGSSPTPNTARAWADMYDGYQRAALDTPLRVPLLYGVDAVHGHNNVHGATIFPHNIGLGATRDPELVRRIGRATAEEVAGTGIHWDFAPCLAVVRDPRWGRTYEAFGEVPAIPEAMATMVSGLQDGVPSVLATAKHYLGDGGTTGGVDRGDTRLSEAELRALHLPPFRAAVERGVGSVMVSYSAWNGLPLHAHAYLLTTVLKGELGFDGIVVSDYNAVDLIDGEPGFTPEEVRTAVNAGLDMVMVPSEWRRFIAVLCAEVEAGRVPMARVDDAVRRILTAKFRLGLFESPLADRSWTPSVGSPAHRALAREAVRASQVLLHNDGGALPLARAGARYLVTGRNADDMGHQCGGWSITWQGSSGAITPGTTILDGIRAAAGGAEIVHDPGAERAGDGWTAAIAVLGEAPYAEFKGDRPELPGLDEADLAVLARLRAAGVPVVVVLVSGRPLDVAAHAGDWAALVAAWLPGTEGAGVADVLFGDHPPAGRLPVTWPGLYPFGHGLSY